MAEKRMMSQVTDWWCGWQWRLVWGVVVGGVVGGGGLGVVVGSSRGLGGCGGGGLGVKRM